MSSSDYFQALRKERQRLNDQQSSRPQRSRSLVVPATELDATLQRLRADPSVWRARKTLDWQVAMVLVEYAEFTDDLSAASPTSEICPATGGEAPLPKGSPIDESLTGPCAESGETPVDGKPAIDWRCGSPREWLGFVRGWYVYTLLYTEREDFLLDGRGRASRHADMAAAQYAAAEQEGAL